MEQLQALLTQLKDRRASTIQEKIRSLDIRDDIWRKYTELLKGKTNALEQQRTGVCQDMCCERERLTRGELQGGGFKSYEYDQETKTLVHSLMVTEYSRASADQPMPSPYDLRSGPVLLKTMSYLITNIMDRFDVERDKSEWYNFLWDRTRAIRKELTQQRIRDEISIQILEQCSRFYIFCSAFLSEYRRELFDPNLNDKMLIDCLNQLKDLYTMFKRQNQSKALKNIAEFCSYMLLINLKEDNETLLRIRHLFRDLTTNFEMQIALDIHRQLLVSNTTRFFQLIEKSTLLQSCLLNRYFSRIRAKRLDILVQSTRPNDECKISELSLILGMDSEKDTCEYLESAGFNLGQDSTTVILNLNDRPEQLPITRLSQKLILSKYQRNLKDIISGNGTICSTTSARTPVEDNFDEQGYFTGDLRHIEQFIATHKRTIPQPKSTLAPLYQPQTQQQPHTAFKRPIIPQPQPKTTTTTDIYRNPFQLPIASSTSASPSSLFSKLPTSSSSPSVFIQRPLLPTTPSNFQVQFDSRAMTTNTPSIFATTQISTPTSSLFSTKENDTISSPPRPQITTMPVSRTHMPTRIPSLQNQKTILIDQLSSSAFQILPHSLTTPAMPVAKKSDDVEAKSKEPVILAKDNIAKERLLTKEIIESLIIDSYDELLNEYIEQIANDNIDELITVWNKRVTISIDLCDEFINDEFSELCNECYQELKFSQKMIMDTLHEQYERKRRRYLSKKYFFIWLITSRTNREDRLILKCLQDSFTLKNNEQVLELLAGIELITIHHQTLEDVSQILKLRRQLKQKQIEDEKILHEKWIHACKHIDFVDMVKQQTNQLRLSMMPVDRIDYYSKWLVLVPMEYTDKDLHIKWIFSKFTTPSNETLKCGFNSFQSFTWSNDRVRTQFRIIGFLGKLSGDEEKKIIDTKYLLGTTGIILFSHNCSINILDEYLRLIDDTIPKGVQLPVQILSTTTSEVNNIVKILKSYTISNHLQRFNHNGLTPLIISDLYRVHGHKLVQLLDNFLSKTVTKCKWEIKTLDIIVNKLNFEFETIKKTIKTFQHTIKLNDIIDLINDLLSKMWSLITQVSTTNLNWPLADYLAPYEENVLHWSSNKLINQLLQFEQTVSHLPHINSLSTTLYLTREHFNQLSIWNKIEIYCKSILEKLSKIIHESHEQFSKTLLTKIETWLLSLYKEENDIISINLIDLLSLIVTHIIKSLTVDIDKKKINLNDLCGIFPIDTENMLLRTIWFTETQTWKRIIESHRTLSISSKRSISSLTSSHSKIKKHKENISIVLDDNEQSSQLTLSLDSWNMEMKKFYSNMNDDLSEMQQTLNSLVHKHQQQM